MPTYPIFLSLPPVIAAGLYLATATVPPQPKTLVITNSNSVLTAAQVLTTKAVAVIRQQQVKTQKPSSKGKPLNYRLTKSLPAPQVVAQGTQMILNGRTRVLAWKQWQVGTEIRTGIGDIGLMQHLGVELLNGNDASRQAVQWFSANSLKPVTLAAWQTGGYRYLDITDFAKMVGWELQANGENLTINSPTGRAMDIRRGKQTWGDRIVIDLDRPVPWQVSQQNGTAVITLESTADPALLDKFKPPTANPLNLPIFQAAPTPEPSLAGLKVESAQNQTTIQVDLPNGWKSQVWTSPDPNRIVIDIAPELPINRDLLWSSGLRWREQYINLGSSRFLVTWLEVNLRSPGITLKPILGQPDTVLGINPLVQMARQSEAVAAINGGFFNRNEKLPLGAIRRDHKWLSSPILNRGAIAWNDLGNVKIGRLGFQETLTITESGQSLPILFLNSGYVQAGIARYTPEWGATYTPLIDDEIIVVVQSDTVTSQLAGGKAGKTAFPIPPDGYLLTLRAIPNAANLLSAGAILDINTSTLPDDFNRYPNIIGAGPLLLQNRQIVLDAKAEKFRDDFITEAAIRSAVGTTANGTLIIASVRQRVGGPGPNLVEVAQIMQVMGAVDALNLDGGSSTSLYLGGQLIDRSAVTAGRVHNGLGIFIQSNP